MAGQAKPHEYRGLGGGQTWVSEQHGSQLEQTADSWNRLQGSAGTRQSRRLGMDGGLGDTSEDVAFVLRWVSVLRCR